MCICIIVIEICERVWLCLRKKKVYFRYIIVVIWFLLFLGNMCFIFKYVCGIVKILVVGIIKCVNEMVF